MKKSIWYYNNNNVYFFEIFNQYNISKKMKNINNKNILLFKQGDHKFLDSLDNNNLSEIKYKFNNLYLNNFFLFLYIFFYKKKNNYLKKKELLNIFYFYFLSKDVLFY
jgi:hypothetical protein